MNTQTLTSNEALAVTPTNPTTQPLTSLVKTALWALVLLLAPPFILSVFFGVYYGAQQGENVNADAFNTWFNTTPILLTLTLLSVFLLLPLLIKATPAKTWSERFNFWALKPVKRNHAITWLFIGLLYWAITSFIGLALNLPTENFMLEVKAAANSLPMLALVLTTICLVAPISEEVIFRGWLFSKIAQTKLGGTGAIVISSLAFTLVHAQYQQLSTLVMVFALGLLLSWVRYKSNNISYTILMHMLFNGLAMASLFLF
ncbi:MAG: CPBP family intramembrane metalloprotease [Aliivibrio sp.]|uniref:CPBP family intramembrane glutamic endopeptidase n=1 Tax=Aliivibrio sp. TaxID=1872443 RepID=UPI001A461D38|nr:CPBP family intramembrane metalloprotease [Aliivibrio sp.]